MIKSKLLNKDYYINKLPLYLKKSYGIAEQFESFFEILKQVNDISDEIFEIYNIWNLGSNWNDFGFIKWLADKFYDGDINEARTSTDFKGLDRIGKIYGINRQFTIDGNEYHLTNDELLLLILFNSSKQAYDGTYETSKKIYEMLRLPIYYTVDYSAAVNVWLDINALVSNNYFGRESEAVVNLFLAGLFTFKSMGIVYNESDLEVDEQNAKYDSPIKAQAYDFGLYS